MADVLLYLVQLANVLNVDLVDAAQRQECACASFAKGHRCRSVPAPQAPLR